MGNKNHSVNIFKEQKPDNQIATFYKAHETHNLIIGVGQNNKSIILHFDTKSGKLSNLQSPEGFPCYNYSSIVMTSPEEVYLTGGITKDLKEIKKIAFLLNLNGFSLVCKKLHDLQIARYTHMSIINKNFLYVMGGRTFGRDEKGILNNCEKIDSDIRKNKA